jgi:hypothetical protein
MGFSSPKTTATYGVWVTNPDGNSKWMTDTNADNPDERACWTGTREQAEEEAAERARVHGRKGFTYKVLPIIPVRQ